MIAFPVQSLRGGDPLGWSAKVGEPRQFLATVDQALEAALRERGLAPTWAFAADLTRIARRNPTYATEPAAIRAGDAVRVMERRKDAQIPEPVASQIRVLAGFHDARHALVPVEFRFDAAPGMPGGRAVLHFVVLDVRASRISWSGDVASEVLPEFSPALATAVARRFADLIVAR
jgi:hypothetical protein